MSVADSKATAISSGVSSIAGDGDRGANVLNRSLERVDVEDTDVACRNHLHCLVLTKPASHDKTEITVDEPRSQWACGVVNEPQHSRWKTARREVFLDRPLAVEVGNPAGTLCAVDRRVHEVGYSRLRPVSRDI